MKRNRLLATLTLMSMLFISTAVRAQIPLFKGIKSGASEGETVKILAKAYGNIKYSNGRPYAEASFNGEDYRIIPYFNEKDQLSSIFFFPEDDTYYLSNARERVKYLTEMLQKAGYEISSFNWLETIEKDTSEVAVMLRNQEASTIGSIGVSRTKSGTYRAFFSISDADFFD